MINKTLPVNTWVIAGRDLGIITKVGRHAGADGCWTTHAERAARWDEKNAEQIELTAQICHSGTSPQCGDVP